MEKEKTAMAAGGARPPADCARDPDSRVVIAPTEYQAEIETVLENKDAGFVKVGQHAEAAGRYGCRATCYAGQMSVLTKKRMRR